MPDVDGLAPFPEEQVSIREEELVRELAGLRAERDRLRAAILRLPAAVALTEGPEHRFALIKVQSRPRQMRS